MTIRKVLDSELEVSDVHQLSLSKSQEQRVTAIADAPADVYPKSYGEWLHGFMCDLNAGCEIGIWGSVGTGILVVRGRTNVVAGRPQGGIGSLCSASLWVSPTNRS